MQFYQWRRREFITLLGGAATWPSRRVRSRQRAGCGVSVCSCRQPRTIRNFRLASGHSCRHWRSWAGPSAATCASTPAGPRPMPTEIRRHAVELATLAPDTILAHGASTVGTLLQATRTVPIVFPVVADPVGAGFVDSLARPGGNATGFMTVRIQHGREMAGAAQADRARRDASGGPSRSHPRLRDQPVCRHPGGGAVAQGGGQPGQYARRQRDRARRRGLRALFEWRSDRDGGRVRVRFIAI